VRTKVSDLHAQSSAAAMNYLVSFDIDNTLVKSSAGHMESLILAIQDIYGLKTSIDAITHHGMTDPEIIIGILGKYAVDGHTIQSMLEKCMDRMQRRYARIVQAENIVILDGVLELLTQLDQNGFLLGLVTGNLEPIARAKLKRIGISDFFKFGGFGSDNISRTELVKIAIRRAANQFKLDGDNQIFHLGDAPQDMLAAREAGVIPIGVTTGIFSAEALKSAGAYRIVPDLKDTDAILHLLSNAAR
jgi:phosphoglycolate phosphatase-like HAD superfamily hydrolase